MEQLSTHSNITQTELQNYWQGHRRVKRRTILAFPESELFTYSIGGKRPFSEMVKVFKTCTSWNHKGCNRKMLKLNELGHHSGSIVANTKNELLKLWDELTALINTLWLQIPTQRFQEIDKAFGEYKGQISGLIQYWIDNEIHHRGQGYVYLRSLGIEPPAFWDRS